MSYARFSGGGVGGAGNQKVALPPPGKRQRLRRKNAAELEEGQGGLKTPTRKEKKSSKLSHLQTAKRSSAWGLDWAN